MAMTTMYDLFGDKTIERPPTPLKQLLLLPSTADVEAEATINAQTDTDTLARYQRRLDDAHRRDAIQATRPAGCWCLGLGGKIECVGGPNGERVLAETCTCSEGLAAQLYRDTLFRTIQQTRKRERIANTWENACIPLRFDAFRLETSPWLVTHPEIMDRLRVLDERDTESWFIYGPYGCGKTGIAVGIGWERVTDYSPTDTLRFVAAPRLFSELRSTYNRDSGETEQEVIDRYAKADLLILDDIGAEQVKNQDWLADRLYQIVGERHDELRATIFTSNLSLEQLAKRVGERVTWRIVEMVGKNIIHVDGPNLRA